VGGCTAGDAGELTAEREAALADTLRSVLQDFNDAFFALEPGPYLDYFPEDFHFYGRADYMTRTEYGEGIRELMGGDRDWSGDVRDVRVEVLGPDAGTASYTWRATVVDTAGNEEEHAGAVTVVFERREGEWRVVRAHESQSTPDTASRSSE
jgi:ketosteroid isomerase-like protein